MKCLSGPLFIFTVLPALRALLRNEAGKNIRIGRRGDLRRRDDPGQRREAR
ncbi:MAG: hypothetical protein V8T90_14735 [Victivallales bacterium]